MDFKQTVYVILGFLFIIILISIEVEAENQCQVAWPQFGVVRCSIDTNSQPNYNNIGYSHQDAYSTVNYQCNGRCDIENKGSITNGFSCSISTKEWEVYRGGTLIASSGGFWGGGFSSFPIEFNDKDSITIKSWCDYLLTKSKVSENAEVAIRTWNKYLYEETPDWPEHKIESSVNCAPQTWISNYLDQGISSGSVPSKWVDSSGSQKDQLSNHPNVQYNLQNLPTVMSINTDYSYFYKWIVVPDINVVYTKSGDLAGYCGGTTGNRKLFEYSEVNTKGGNCYLIPSSVKKNVECCSNEDCRLNPSKPTCDPTTFSCTDKKPCNSDIECQVPGQTSQCSNKQETSWKCDTNQEWYPYSGTCVQTTKSVACCSDSECGVDQYCNKDKGCLDKYTKIECPANKCCKPGGRYNEQACGPNLLCCPSPDPIVGDCRKNCEIIKEPTPVPAIVGDAIIAVINGVGNIDLSTEIAGIPIEVTIGNDYKQVQQDSPIALGPIIGSLVKYLPIIISVL